jgi:flagellin-like hook-associated protein FlgL
MSDIVLSSSVRQNLLSLQSTADLLSTTQNRLATGKKVNTALDNPTNYFTAASLDSRASDINNLLDGIGNGVQVLQAANTGISSLQKLIDSAKSVANQALQTQVGYSSKSSVTTTVAGATADNLLGGVASNAVASATGAITPIDLSDTPAANAVLSAPGAITPIDLTTPTTPAASASTVSGTYAGDEFASGDSITIDGQTVSFDGTTDGTAAIAGASYTATEAVAKINHDLGLTSSTVTASVGTGPNAGKIVLTNSATGTASNFAVTGNVANTGNGGFATSTVTTTNGTDVVPHADLTFDVNGHAVTLAGGASYTGTQIATAINGVTGIGVSASYSSGKLVLTSTGTAGAGDSVTVNNFSTGTAAQLGFTAGPSATASGSALVPHANLTFDVNGHTVTLAHGSSYTGTQIAAAINGTAGVGASASYASGKLVLTSTGTAGASDTVTVNNFSTGDATQLGFAGVTGTGTGSDSSGGLSGQTLTIASTDGGVATNITFGTASGQVKSLNDLNAALASNNLQATINSAGAITITTSNDAASATIGAIGGGAAFTGLVGGAAVKDAAAQATRADLVSQYNNILSQINTTSQDSSYNGINLLNGDQLKLTFNETGKSTLNITGVNFSAAGLGLSTLNAGTDFVDNGATNSVLASLNNASSTLRSQASALGSNLSIVQIRQDFSKNLINVLQTGSSNLTLADTNEEAANSQALSTRQSIAVSALALANQSQQSVLQLLR